MTWLRASLKKRLEESQVVAARGFDYYPLPCWLQPAPEALDPAYCHQMVFVCRKP